MDRPESANKKMNGDDQLRNRKSKFLANTSAESSCDAQANLVATGTQNKGKSIGAMLNAIYKYSRVYVLKGTVLSIISISLLAVQSLSDLTPSFFLGVLQAVIGGCLANLYVVGFNQLSDIEIDKINKPYLPLASGELSVKEGIRITSLYAILVCQVSVFLFSSLLLLLLLLLVLLLSFVIGSAVWLLLLYLILFLFLHCKRFLNWGLIRTNQGRLSEFECPM
ncbi:putative homogentisate phytyltransferase [Helianthus annuus]|uniref:Homogentisate phytyltransferase n=1 Tax=Helianthus annuus TaxID=4232 RepID=A0A251SSN5_HELAN|nr:putative homogentisate phytyltransferase [Helianthus annuus]KAJ0477077.1 putative homogentisate phytyltransferase [Helianthus annuus]KAJ0497897.1 putative homogentisate phytyltransferase [Helianthus annuus]KAJ0663904.1 putative homogentisate phytyltransferase [Helianthus annuus]KAJ0671394.1 putative homogentisate phytyltransferase [Helianthus annuus]